jgi:hypothetical protein
MDLMNSGVRRLSDTAAVVQTPMNTSVGLISLSIRLLRNSR